VLKVMRQTKYFIWLFGNSKPYILKIVLLIFCDVAASSFGVVLALLSKEIIDSATSGGVIKISIILYFIVILISILINAIIGLLSSAVNERFSFDIRKQIYDRIVKSYWMDIKRYHTGDLLTRLTSDTSNVSEGIVSVIPTIIKLVIEILITFFTLFYFQPMLAILALIMAPIISFTCLLLGRKLKLLQRKVQETESNYRSFIQESLSNLLVVKSFANEKYVSDRLAQLRDERFFWVFRKNRISVVSSSAMSLSFQLGYIAALTFGAVLLSAKTITFGTMSVFLTLVNRIQSPILSLAYQIPRVVSVLASSERIVELQKIALEGKDEKHILPEDVGVNLFDVTFGYGEEIILDGVSLSIEPGEFVAIVGKSGIGKTTLVRLIMSFMNNMDGIIEFQNKQGETVNANAGTREFIAYVPQGNTLFSGTIRENIRMGRLNATEEDMINALKMAAAYDFVCEFPKGIDTVIGERGHGISEGQAQRIAIARALVRNAPFLILDEATSSLDERTELEVLRGIQNLYPRPTCLIISHRRSVLKYCNREIRISNKKIIEKKPYMKNKRIEEMSYVSNLGDYRFQSE
jgi:ATP-binding cassette, subfamily B, bacterial